MAVALRGSASVPVGNPTTGFTVTIDAATQTDDLCYLVLASRDSTGAGTLAVTDNDSGGNTWSKIGNSTDHKITLWYKRATSGTASKTVTVANAVGSTAGVLKVFSGASTATTPHTNIVVETNASGDETHAGFTPGRAGSMICAGVVNYANDNAVTSLSFATAGATTATEKLSTGGSDCGAIFGHVLQSGGPTGTGNLTWAQTDGTTYSIVWAIMLLSGPIAADTGSYAITGAAATLDKDSKIVSDTGSYAITGSAATLSKGYSFAANAGAYVITGSDATLTKTSAGYTLAVDTGSYAITGSAATFRLDYRVTSNTGAYSVTGTDAGLSYQQQPSIGLRRYFGTLRSIYFLEIGEGLAAFTLAADTGSYAVTGTATNLLKATRMTADSGSYAITGTAANLLRGLRFNTDAGVYSITGATANLFKSLVFAANTGAYNITGSDVTFRRALRFTTDTGTYAITGSTANLLVAHKIAANTGTYAINGVNATLFKGFFLVANSGVYAITGTASQLQVARKILTDAGVYVITGMDANLLYAPSGLAFPGPIEALVGVSASRRYTSVGKTKSSAIITSTRIGAEND